MLSTSQEEALIFLRGIFGYKKTYEGNYLQALLPIVSDTYIPELASLICSYVQVVFPVNNGELRMNILKGCAGSGKTFCTSVFIDEIPEGWNIIISSPTHKAKSVIMNQIRSLGVRNRYRIKFNTVASLLSKKKIYDKEGKSDFVNYDKYSDSWDEEEEEKRKDIIFIDEASMLCECDYHLLKEFIDKNTGSIVVFIADHCQLPPVDEDKSIIYDRVKRSFTLEGNKRSTVDSVKDITGRLRDYVIGGKFDIYNTKHVFRTDIFNKRIYETFVPGVDKVLSYSNKKTVYYNELIRKKFFNNPKNKYVSGENLVFTDFFTNSACTYYTGDEVVVTDCEVVDMIHAIWGIAFKVYSINLNNNAVYIIHEDDKARYDKYAWEQKCITAKKVRGRFITRHEVNELWREYNDAVQLFNTPLDYSYAKTVYQSQGSTYGKVFIDVNNISACTKRSGKDLFSRTLYTAASRASEEVIIFCINNVF